MRTPRAARAAEPAVEVAFAIAEVGAEAEIHGDAGILSGKSTCRVAAAARTAPASA